MARKMCNRRHRQAKKIPYVSETMRASVCGVEVLKGLMIAGDRTSSCRVGTLESFCAVLLDTQSGVLSLKNSVALVLLVANSKVSFNCYDCLAQRHCLVLHSIASDLVPSLHDSTRMVSSAQVQGSVPCFDIEHMALQRFQKRGDAPGIL